MSDKTFKDIGKVTSSNVNLFYSYSSLAGYSQNFNDLGANKKSVR
jgi:hypothetical protein